MKSPYLAGHSRGVSHLASEAARCSGLPDADAVALRRAGLVHDVGRVAVSSVVWNKKGPLSGAEWELGRLHPHHTGHVLARTPRLAELLTPVVAGPSPKAGSMTGRGYLATLRQAAATAPYTQAWNLAGLPAISVPTGVVDDRPTAVQLIAKPGDEAKMLALAAALESYLRPPDRAPALTGLADAAQS
jgi:Asp-tRNA(Asn)/Glu-tRNA(Gln) amidotransferase A subunit family amidase